MKSSGQSVGRRMIYGGKDLWNRCVLSLTDPLHSDRKLITPNNIQYNAAIYSIHDVHVVALNTKVSECGGGTTSANSIYPFAYGSATGRNITWHDVYVVTASANANAVE